LGKENLALIVHGSSFPARDGEDTGFGTFNSESGHALIDYASGIFNAIQLGPAGKTKCSDSSPYCGTIFSGNPLFIDLKQLTTKEWGEILSIESFLFNSSIKCLDGVLSFCLFNFCSTDLLFSLLKFSEFKSKLFSLNLSSLVGKFFGDNKSKIFLFLVFDSFR
jgi:hypothetical protein